MEFTLDVSLVREILQQEHARMREEITQIGAIRAFANSQLRHDARIAAASDVGTLACGAGCSWCCHFTVDVRAAEVFRILDFVNESFTSEQRFRTYAEIRANSAALASLDETERVTRNLKCPFLSDGRCGIYPVRPQSCRNYHATDATGCKQSFEEPDNLDIDPDFAPGVFQAGAAHIEAVVGALCDEGYDSDVYELNGAMDAALAEPAARARFEERKRPFVTLEGSEVPLEFEDLRP